MLGQRLHSGFKNAKIQGSIKFQGHECVGRIGEQYGHTLEMLDQPFVRQFQPSGCSTISCIVNLYMYARKKMDGKSHDEVMVEIKRVVQELNMHSFLKTSVERLSGGQLKLLEIAKILLLPCKIMFCDEITSGLDSNSTHLVISRLKRLVQRKNVSVLVVIHQPSNHVFHTFDHVIAMNKGKIMYDGAPADVRRHLPLDTIWKIPNLNRPMMLISCSSLCQKKVKDGML